MLFLEIVTALSHQKWNEKASGLLSASASAAHSQFLSIWRGVSQ